MIKSAFFLIVWLLPFLSFTQNIGGVINRYTPVLSISGSNCLATITVGSVNGFAVNDKVLIIQMKGAVIDSSNTATFGTVTNLNGAGNYEFSRIASITGNTIQLTANLTNTYYIPGRVQLIKVPEYTDVTITSTLQALAWNGQSGGVLAFLASGTVTFNADINVTGKGFMGGYISNNPDGSCGANSTAYFYPLSQPGSSWSTGGAMKGEGISMLIDNHLAGKGKLANGGGGGNKHNCGGGGGGNFTAGGQGGEVLAGCALYGNMGIGGQDLLTYIQGNRVYLGGGGGCGDYNNSVGSDGAAGGGIVFLRAASIVGNGYSIIANGKDETIIGTGIADGVGGGGAGGTVFLDVASYTGNLSILANGGYGGDQDPYYGCVGTGGGGGTGGLITSQASVPGNVVVTTLPGREGRFLATNTSCSYSNYFSAPGQPNVNGIIYNLPFIESAGNGTFTFNLGNDTTVCAGDTIFLEAPAGASNLQWQDGSNGTQYMVTNSGDYWLQISQGVCSARDTVNVTFIQGPAIDLGNDTALCPGQTIVLNQNGSGTGYLWQDGSTTQTYTVSQAGLYILEASEGPCSRRDSIVIGEVADLTLGNDTTLCDGELLILKPDISGVSYLWQDGSTAATYTVLAGGLYHVTIATPGCSATDTIRVTYTTNPIISLGNDTLLCTNQTLLLNQNGVANSYLWQDGSTAQVYTVTQPGLYIVIARNGQCVVTDSIDVSSIEAAANLGNDTTLCEGENLLLVTPQLSNASYTWQDGSGGNTYTVTLPGVYWVRAISAGCQATDTLVVNYTPYPVIELGNDTILCSGQSVVLNQNGNASAYVWQDGTTAQVYVANQPGLYYVSAANLNCYSSDSIQVSFIAPMAYTLPTDTVVCEGSIVQLQATCTGCSYSWGNGAVSPYITVTTAGMYQVTITNGCETHSSEARVTYIKCACTVFVPNAFTPNNDGNNDKLAPLYNCDVVYHRFQIFNRWGEKMFETNNLNDGWDGTYKGTNAPAAVYVYVLTYTGKEEYQTNTYNLKGSLTLIR